MKTKLLAAALALLLALCVCHRRTLTENRRLKANQRALTQEITRTRNRLGEATAECERLHLSHRELKRLRRQDAERIRRLGISLRHAQSIAQTAAATRVSCTAPVRDTVVIRDTLRLFRWNDRWVTVEGCVGRDSVHCRVESIDTLRQIVHRVPRRFLFFRWGTKAVRQQISSSNPHTRIVYTEYIRLGK